MLKLFNTRELLGDGQLKLKMLIYSPSGYGKSEFVSTAPNVVVGAGETGHGKGLLTLGQKSIMATNIQTYTELEEFCSGNGLDSYDTLALDGFSYLTDTAVKTYALTVPRTKGGDSKKRAMGIPELDDYGTMAELERRVLAKLLSLDKHIIVTCLQDYYQPPEEGRAEKIGGPDLPGSMRLGSAAMFDIVMRLYTRSALANPKDANSRFQQRVFQTESDGKYLAKSRLRNNKSALFPSEVVFDLNTGHGSFPWFLEQARKAYDAAPVAAGGSAQ